MTMVPSSVDISCMPVIATIAMPSTDDDRGVLVRSVDPGEPTRGRHGLPPYPMIRIRRGLGGSALAAR